MTHSLVRIALMPISLIVDITVSAVPVLFLAKQVYDALPFEIFLLVAVPLGLALYPLFLAFLMATLSLSQGLFPVLEDGVYEQTNHVILMYELRQLYYVIFGYFMWLYGIFLNVRLRHIAFGTIIGEGTIMGHALLFNPERTIIGKNCFFGYNAIITGHVYENGKLILQKVKIGDNCTIGANVVIFPGVEIGDNVIIGANTVIPKGRKIPSNTTWVGGSLRQVGIPKRENIRIDSRKVSLISDDNLLLAKREEMKVKETGS